MAAVVRAGQASVGFWLLSCTFVFQSAAVPGLTFFKSPTIAKPCSLVAIMKTLLILILSFYFHTFIFGQLNFDISKVKGYSKLNKDRNINSDTLYGPTDISLSKHKYEIRLSVFYAPVGGFGDYILFSDGGQWTARLWKAEMYNLYDTTKPKYKTIKNLNSDTILNKLNSYGFFTLPNQSKLKNKFTVMDGSMYTVSYKVDNKYRQYHFDNPSIYSKQYPETVEFKKYMEIVTTFYDTFRE